MNDKNDRSSQPAPCILLVDKSIAFLTLARQYLHGTRARIVEADSLESSLEACRLHSPQLIYMAANLSAPGGVECCRRLKEHPDYRDIPVVLVAREKDGDRAKLSRSSNCDAVVGMPIIKQNFLGIARSFLAGVREDRHDCQLPTCLMLQEGPRNTRSVDISGNGAFIAHSELPSLGQTIQVELQLAPPGQKGPRISCLGQVAWLNGEDQPMKPHYPSGFGIRFTSLSPHDAAVLNGFLKSQQPHPPQENKPPQPFLT